MTAGRNPSAGGLLYLSVWRSGYYGFRGCVNIYLLIISVFVQILMKIECYALYFAYFKINKVIFK